MKGIIILCPKQQEPSGDFSGRLECRSGYSMITSCPHSEATHDNSSTNEHSITSPIVDEAVGELSYLRKFFALTDMTTGLTYVNASIYICNQNDQMTYDILSSYDIQWWYIALTHKKDNRLLVENDIEEFFKVRYQKYYIHFDIELKKKLIFKVKSNIYFETF